MVTIHDKGSDNVRLRSGSGHVMTKKTSIWVPMCKEKRMKNSGESDFCHMEWEYKVTNKSWLYREVVEWEIRLMVCVEKQRVCCGVGIKVKGLSREVKSVAWGENRSKAWVT